jgi:GxxExxY protein
VAEIKLSTPLEEVMSGMQKRFLRQLKYMDIKTVKDLLWHFPVRHEDRSEFLKISELKKDEEATIQGMVQNSRTRYIPGRKLSITDVRIADENGEIIILSFFNQPYIANTLKEGRVANFSGKVSEYKGKLTLKSPVYEIISRKKADSTRTNAEKRNLRGSTSVPRESESIPRKSALGVHTGRLVPVYHETKGLTSRGLRFIIKPILDNLEELHEYIPEKILHELGLPDINEAIQQIHFPNKEVDAIDALESFAFRDLFLLQIRNGEEKRRLREQKAHPIKYSEAELKEILSYLPFELTASQKKTLDEILDGVKKSHPMNRLLQGDVGSGKTIVAGIAALLAAKNGFQTVFMAPTEILARQHFQTLIKFFEEYEGGIALLVSKETKIFYGEGLETQIKKTELAKKICSGNVGIVVGTHAVIQKNIQFKNLAFAVVDEQHRFGVQQRASLVARGNDAEEAQTNAENGLLYEDLTYQIRGAAFEIKKQLGLGHKESVYQRAFGEELSKRNIKFEKEKSINIKYRGKSIGTYQPDLLIEKKVILELKALPYVGEAHQKQLWSYLKGSSHKLALLINFGGKDLEIRRVVYDSARSPRESASDQRESALAPHFLSMSATPIPRTLTMTIFGNLDLSLINELPKGRKPITTKIVEPQNRGKAYDFIRQQIKVGRQVFVICPRIEEQAPNDANSTQTYTEKETLHKSAPIPRESVFSLRKSALDAWAVKAVKVEYEKLSKQIFPDLKVGMLHGKMKTMEKAKVMHAFAEGKIDILVSTSVVEVGVDVPNASIMMIEGADRFGLSQLYQFRGRVGRGEHQSFCLLFTDSKSNTVQERLQSLVTAKNGFELAEMDLRLRGPGEFLGDTQTGMPDLALKALQNPELLKTAQDKAESLLNEDPNFKKYPLLKTKLAQFKREIHLE